MTAPKKLLILPMTREDLILILHTAKLKSISKEDLAQIGDIVITSIKTRGVSRIKGGGR
jgi:DNA-directed RNA polymerase subunit F